MKQSTTGTPDDNSTPALLGRRILIVEDRFFVADDLSRMVTRHGAEVAGVAADVDEAKGLAKAETLDVAVLDVDLRGRDVFEVVAVLEGRRVPFVFVTGYSGSQLPEKYRGSPLVSKPFSEPELIAKITDVVGTRRSGAAGGH